MKPSVPAIALLFSLAFAAADTPETQFNKANLLYEKGEYAAAAEAYRQLLGRGTDAAAIRFNLGNALYQTSQFGKAIAQYHQALALSPRNPDILANLRFARNKLGAKTAIPLSFWRQFLLQLTLNEWTLLAMIPFWSWLAGAILSLLSAKNSRRWTTFSRIAGIACLPAALLLMSAAYERFQKPLAIVINPEAVVRFGPFDESKSSHNLSDGTEVRILDSKDNWRQIRDPQGQIGWLREDQIQPLPTLP